MDDRLMKQNGKRRPPTFLSNQLKTRTNTAKNAITRTFSSVISGYAFLCTIHAVPVCNHSKLGQTCRNWPQITHAIYKDANGGLNSSGPMVNYGSISRRARSSVGMSATLTR